MNSQNSNQGPYCTKDVNMDFIIKAYQPEDILGLGEAADALGISKEAINVLINEGKIPCLKIKDRDNELVILKKDLDKAIYQKQTGDQPDDVDDIRKMIKTHTSKKAGKNKKMVKQNPSGDLKNVDSNLVESDGSGGYVLTWNEYSDSKTLYSLRSIKNRYGYRDDEMYKVYDAAKKGKFGKATKFRGGSRKGIYLAYDIVIVDNYINTVDIEFQHKPDIKKTQDELAMSKIRSKSIINTWNQNKQKKVKQNSKKKTTSWQTDINHGVNVVINKINVGENVGFAKQMNLKTKYNIITVHFDIVGSKDGQIHKIPPLRLGIYEGMKQNEILQKLLKAVKSDVIFTTNTDFIKEKLLHKSVLPIFKYITKPSGKKICKYIDFMPTGSWVSSLQSETKPKSQQPSSIKNKLDNIGISVVKTDEVKKLKSEIENYKQIVTNLNEDLTSALNALHHIDEVMILFEDEYKLTEKYIGSVREHIATKNKIRKHLFKTRIKQNIQKKINEKNKK